MSTTVLVGTRKGAFLLSSDDRQRWTLSEPIKLGQIVQHLVADPRQPEHLVMAAGAGHLGPTVFHSDDAGTTWTESTVPPAFHGDEELARSLNAAFYLAPGHASQPGLWFLGGSPQGLFRSDDGGATWAPVDGWNNHPMWTTWAEWPEQNTPDGSMLHSINIDPGNRDHMYIGLSSGGVFETTDGGTGWAPLNAGCEVTFGPELYPEFGHDPHCLRLHPLQPDRLYQQNHCGFYRMDRSEGRWRRVGNNLPADVGDIGFPVELHPRDPDVAWVFPMDGTDVWPRTSPGGRPAAFITRDGGQSWQRQANGLPERGWFTVKRQAMTTDAADPVGIYLGTTSGEVWVSSDEGESWHCAAAHLPEIYSVEIG